MNHYEVLSRYFGYRDFREGQEAVISRILSGGDVLAVMPTGAGKSICYQVPAMLMDGVCVVVSPLISLMKDQVAALSAAGAPAVMINSSLGYGEYMDALNAMRGGGAKLAYVAPERLLNEEFLAAARGAQISMVTVDEAHCVSQWGQNFRPSYLDIPKFVAELPVRPVLSAFTATATERVRADIVARLGLNAPFSLVTGFNRENLRFSVERGGGRMQALLSFVERRAGSSGIVYCLSRKAVEEVCEKLCKNGISATRYHAGLSDAERMANQEDFQNDRRAVMVATNAFGMGIDKSNVAYVAHFGMPKDIESYYQEAGRAGRDGGRAECVLYYGGSDVRTNRFLIEKSLEENEGLTDAQREEIRRGDEARLRAMAAYCTTAGCLRAHILRYFGDSAADGADPCGNCSNCGAGLAEADVTDEARAILNCVHALGKRRLSFGKTMAIAILKGQSNERIRAYGFDNLKVYGSLSALSTHRLGAIIDGLTERGIIEVADGKYPTLSIPQDAAERLGAGGRIIMKLHEAPPKPEKARRARKTVGADGNPPAPADESLFEKLRALRMDLAKSAGVPPFVVFSDATLRDMCRLLPETEEGFLAVSGVGQHKQERYGKAFIEAIKAHLAGK